MVKQSMKARWSLLWALALSPLVAWSQQPAPDAEKQAERDPRGASADGAYWFEVEVTVFSSVYGGGKSSEVPVPNNNNLRYPPQLRRLQNQSDSYQFPFAADLNPVQLAAAAAMTTTALPLGEGPLYSPADPAAFKILDLERDPFLTLDRRAWRFNQVNSRLQSNSEHKVLWHQVWRQPLRPRPQTPALQIEGGAQFGEHYELEGSLRLTGTGDLPVLDANLWLSNFSREHAEQWQLPERPALVPANKLAALQDAVPANSQPNTEAWYPDSIWQLNQSRELSANALYYLDHPTLGLLIEVRPYLVPEPRVPGTTAPVVKPANKRGFE